MADTELQHRRWQDYRAKLLVTLPPYCHICHQWVDKTLPGTHRDGPTLDHIIPRSRGGATYDDNNVALAHQRCNAQRRNDLIEPIHSREW